MIHICILLFNTHVNERLKLNVGGIANQVLQLLPAYEKIKDVKVSLFSKYSEYKPTSDRIKVYNIHKFSIRFIDTLYFYIRFFFMVKKINKIDPIHIINQQNYGYYLIGPLIVREILKIPLLVKTPADIKSHILHAYISRHYLLLSKMIIYGWFKLFKKFIIKKIDFIQAINDRVYNDMLSLKFPKENLLKLPNGISVQDFFSAKKINKNYTIFGYVGRLEKHKNLDFLLNAFKSYLLKYPSDKLLIYGKGMEDKNLSSFINKNNLEQNIVLCGYENDKIKLYSGIDVLINPSFGEGISNTILEAMSTNTIVIASNVSGNNDLIKHKFSGLLFNPKKQLDLLDQMIFVKENFKDVQEIILNAKNEIITKYEINLIAETIVEFLKSRLRVK